MRWLNTAHELYTSGEFRKLRAGLMVERVNDSGILCCEYCGKPILHDYDCIAHHKTEVTATNLNDAEITLNPRNIQLVHLRCHNAIHERFGQSCKKVYMIWGAPCSGKNTFVNANKGGNDIIVDMDALWMAITGGAKYFKPEALKTNVFLLRNTLLDQVKTRTGKWNTAYILSTEPRRASRERICREINAEPIQIKVTREEALKRLTADKERKNVADEWAGYINNFFDEIEE